MDGHTWRRVAVSSKAKRSGGMARLRPFDLDAVGVERLAFDDGEAVVVAEVEIVCIVVHDAGIDGMVTVGEMSSTSIANCIRCSNPKEHELAMTFSFHHLKVDYKDGDKWSLMAPDFGRLKQLFADWQEQMTAGGGWNALFWCNHDQPRIVSRFGDDKTYWKESAKIPKNRAAVFDGGCQPIRFRLADVCNGLFRRLPAGEAAGEFRNRNSYTRLPPRLRKARRTFLLICYM